MCPRPAEDRRLKRIIAIRSLGDVEDVADELVDRFGSLPTR